MGKAHLIEESERTLLNVENKTRGDSLSTLWEKGLISQKRLYTKCLAGNFVSKKVKYLL
jgi:hypothetical protein